MALEREVDTGIQHVRLECRVNGELVALAVEPRVSLLDLLRNELGLTGAKRSCDMQVCGACTVLLDGRPVSSCTLPAFEARGRDVLTIEGLAPAAVPREPVEEGNASSDSAALHPLMQSFIDHAGLQCGYCTPGMILAAKSLLDENPHPTEGEVKEYMQGNICRCTGYKKIVEAIMEAAEVLGSRSRAATG